MIRIFSTWRCFVRVGDMHGVPIESFRYTLLRYVFLISVGADEVRWCHRDIALITK